MDNCAVLNFDALLKPISPDQPAGTDLRLSVTPDSLYYKIRDARTNARTVERAQLQKIEPAKVKAAWQEVISLAVEALSQHTKDLEIAAWLTEALLREHAFAGLRAGFRLLHDLINQFWDKLYPIEDEDGLSTKIAPLVGLNGLENEGTLIVPIAMVPLIEGRTAGSFALWQYQQALEISRILEPEKQAQRIAGGAVILAVIEAAAREASPLFFNQIRTDIQACLTEFSALDKLLTIKCGSEAPPTSRIQGQLNACLDCLTAVLHDIPSAVEMIALAPVQDKPMVEDNVPVQVQEVKSVKANGLNSREEALHSLLQLAEFFRRTEPHSPLSYILERAVRWGRLPLPDLLKELVSDTQAWEQVCNLTGIDK